MIIFLCSPTTACPATDQCPFYVANLWHSIDCVIEQHCHWSERTRIEHGIKLLLKPADGAINVVGIVVRQVFIFNTYWAFRDCHNFIKRMLISAVNYDKWTWNWQKSMAVFFFYDPHRSSRGKNCVDQK